MQLLHYTPISKYSFPPLLLHITSSTILYATQYLAPSFNSCINTLPCKMKNTLWYTVQYVVISSSYSMPALAFYNKSSTILYNTQYLAISSSSSTPALALYNKSSTILNTIQYLGITSKHSNDALIYSTLGHLYYYCTLLYDTLV